jgi:aspartyl-tRNA(Asn)/glutamyl-tRNA(Gln) amidotransferase subunit C
MKLTVEQVDYVAELARLRFNEVEKQAFADQLSDILKYVEKLNELDTEGVSPTTGAVELKNVMREDVARPSLPVEDTIQNGPDKAGDCFRVPKIIE